jgi:hypothetical protein
MCKPYSACVTSAIVVLDCPDSDDHEEIIKAHDLVDDETGPRRTFLRVEHIPKVALDSLKQEDWEYSLDSQADDGLPSWYDLEKVIEAVWLRLTYLLPGRYAGVQKGNLNLAGTKIEKLPDGLTVVGNLYLAYAKIEKLPDGLTVGGKLDITGTKIEKLPDGLTVGGDLYLTRTKIEKLPDGLTVGGDLNLYGTKIEKLPDGLTVGGYLNLYGTKIEKLPEDLKVKGQIYR